MFVFLPCSGMIPLVQFGLVDLQEFASWEKYGKMASGLQIIFDVRWIEDGPVDSFQNQRQSIYNSGCYGSALRSHQCQG